MVGKPRCPDPRQGCRCGRGHGGGEPAVPGGTSERHRPGVARGPAPAGRHGGRHRRSADRQADQDGRSGHVQARERSDGVPEEAARELRTFGRVGPEADGDAAPPAKNSALDSGQGAGHAGLVSVHAVLAGWVRRQFRRDDPVPSGPLCLAARLAGRQGPRAGRLSRGWSISPVAQGPDHDRSARPAPPEGGDRHCGPVDAAVLHPVGRHRPLRRRDPRVRGEGAGLRARLCRGPGRPPRDCRLSPGQGGCTGVADRLQPCRRPGLQRQRGGS